MATISRLLLSAALAAAVSGCAGAQGSGASPHSTAQLACPAGAEPWLRTELYFGLDRAGAADVTEAEFQSFVDGDVTPRFPDGLTVLSSYGQWRGGSGVIVKESSRVVVLLHAGTPDISQKLDEIRAIYRTKFDQESVMRVDGASCVSF